MTKAWYIKRFCFKEDDDPIEVEILGRTRDIDVKRYLIRLSTGELRQAYEAEIYHTDDV